MKLDEEIYKEKADFIKDKLLPLLQAIDNNILDADYRVLCRTPYDLEYVLIHWKNTDDQRVYVTGETMLSLAKDVLRVIK